MEVEPMRERGWTWKLAGIVFLGCMLATAGYGKFPSGSDSTPGTAVAQAAHPADKADTPQQIMAKRAGVYTRTIQFVNASGPQGAPFSGTSKISAILDGHFLMEENDDVVSGKPVHGIRIYGFNNATGNYELASLYTMSNAILLFTGTSSDGGKSVDYSGESATAKGEPLKLHAHFRQIGDDQFVITMTNVNAEGKEIPFQETTYKRKK
jgi:uncharacterized protein DUF1579